MNDKYLNLTNEASDKGHEFFIWLYKCIKRPMMWCVERFSMILLYCIFFLLGMFVDSDSKFIE